MKLQTRIMLIGAMLATFACSLINRVLPRLDLTPVVAPSFAAPTACSHFIATNGDDANPGSADAPWHTLGHAAEAAQPGYTTCLRSGTYEEVEVFFSSSGEANAPITFMAAPGETVTLNSTLTLTRGTSYVNLLGFTVTKFSIWGITLMGDNHHVHLAGLTVIGGEAGIHMTEGESGKPPASGSVSDVVLEDSIVRDAMYTAVDCTPGPCDNVVFRNLEISGSGLEAGYGGDGLGLEKGSNVLVEDCYIHDNGGDGIDLNSRDRDGNIPGILVRRNQVVRNHLQGIKLWSGGRMENNIVWGQGGNPVMVGKYPSMIEVINNVIAYNMWDPAYSGRDYAFVAGYPEEAGPPELTLILVNNIFAFNTGPDVDSSPTGIYIGPGVALTENHNLYWSREDGEIQADFVSGHDPFFTRAEITDGTWAKFTGQGQGDLILDPIFSAGPPNVDFHLQANSPAINAGTTSEAPSNDLAGHPRDSLPDIGAFESE